MLQVPKTLIASSVLMGLLSALTAQATSKTTAEFVRHTVGGFYGFKVNGELVTGDRTLTLAPGGDVPTYTVEPIYEKLGAAILIQ